MSYIVYYGLYVRSAVLYICAFHVDTSDVSPRFRLQYNTIMTFVERYL